MERILTLPLRMLLKVRPAEVLGRVETGLVEHPGSSCPECSRRRILLLSREAHRALRVSFLFRVGTRAIILAAETGVDNAAGKVSKLDSNKA